MNKHTALAAGFFVIAAIVFTVQGFDNLGHGNLFALVFNAAAAVYTAKIGFRKTLELIAARV